MAENITTVLDKTELTDSEATDKFYVIRGTGSDRDHNSALATILAGTPFATAVKALRDENGGSWKVFTPANGTIDTGTWAQNSIVQMQAWEDTITNVGATIKNAVMILIPRWGTVGTAATATSCTFQHAFPGAPDITITIPAGNIAVISFGSSGGVQEYHCIPSSNSAITAAIFKSLTVSGTLSLPAGSIIAGMLATKCVNTSKLDDLAVSSSNLGTKAVITNKINDGAVTTVKLDHTSGSEAVDETAIQTGAVTKTKLGDAAVTEEKLHDGAVTTDKITDAAVTARKCMVNPEQANFSSETLSAGTGLTIYTFNLTSGGYADITVSHRFSGISNYPTVTVQLTNATTGAVLISHTFPITSSSVPMTCRLCYRNISAAAISVNVQLKSDVNTTLVDNTLDGIIFE